VDLSEIDPIFFERTYHVAPDGEPSAKAYNLLATVMNERHRVGIGKFVMREKQYLAAIRPYGRGLALSTMLFEDEVVPQSQIDAMPERRARIPTREKLLAIQIVESLEAPWRPGDYQDDYEKRVRAAIRARAKGAQPTVEPEPERPEVADLMDAL